MNADLPAERFLRQVHSLHLSTKPGPDRFFAALVPAARGSAWAYGGHAQLTSMSLRHSVAREMNRGALKLSRKFKVRGAQSKLAARLGIDQGYLSRIASGDRVPGLDVRRKLQDDAECRIPMQWWDEAPPRAEGA